MPDVLTPIFPFFLVALYTNLMSQTVKYIYIELTSFNLSSFCTPLPRSNLICDGSCFLNLTSQPSCRPARGFPVWLRAAAAWAAGPRQHDHGQRPTSARQHGDAGQTGHQESAKEAVTKQAACV